MAMLDIESLLQDRGGTVSGIDDPAFIIEPGLAGGRDTSKTKSARTLKKSEFVIEITAFHHFADFRKNDRTNSVLDNLREFYEILPVVNKGLLDRERIPVRVIIDFISGFIHLKIKVEPFS